MLVDIAERALSPAINDPTTAVLVLDQLHVLLRRTGKRRLTDGRMRDAGGELRLAYRTPNWSDFVTLAVTEIRHFGAGSLRHLLYARRASRSTFSASFSPRCSMKKSVAWRSDTERPGSA